MGTEVPLGRAALVGLPDAAVEADGSLVREVPQAAGLHPEGRPAESCLRDVRACRLLCVSQDKGLRDRPQAGADSDENRLEADARLGENVDPESARGEANHVDAAHLVQLELQLA